MRLLPRSQPGQPNADVCVDLIVQASQRGSRRLVTQIHDGQPLAPGRLAHVLAIERSGRQLPHQPSTHGLGDRPLARQRKCRSPQHPGHPSGPRWPTPCGSAGRRCTLWPMTPRYTAHRENVADQERLHQPLRAMPEPEPTRAAVGHLHIGGIPAILGGVRRRLRVRCSLPDAKAFGRSPWTPAVDEDHSSGRWRSDARFAMAQRERRGAPAHAS